MFVIFWLCLTLQEGGSDPLRCSLSVRELVASALENLRSPFILDPSVTVCASPMQPSTRIGYSLRRHSFILVRSVILCSFMPRNPNLLQNSLLKERLLSELEVPHSLAY